MIEIEGLKVEYSKPVNAKGFTGRGRVTALEDFNLKLDRGDVCAIIGPSGCGKSTLLYVLSGIKKDYSGKVFINQSPPDPKKQRLGYIPQNFGLLDWCNVYENAVLGLEMKRIPFNKKAVYYNEANTVRDIIQELNISQILTKLGLNNLKDRYPSQLSGGQKQRVSIARSLILNPEILLMDEPFSALDAITREEAQDMFLDLWRENNITTVFVTHSIEEAVYLGNKIGIMSPSPGRIIKILDNPLFGRKNLRLTQEYYEFCLDVRRYAKEAWVKC